MRAAASLAVHFAQARRLRAAAARRPAADRRSSRPARLAARARAAGAGRRARPARRSRAPPNRRGLVVYVAARARRPRRRAALGARAGRRRVARRPRRAARPPARSFEVAGCHGYGSARAGARAADGGAERPPRAPLPRRRAARRRAAARGAGAAAPPRVRPASRALAALRRALALFGALHWMALLAPSAGRAGACSARCSPRSARGGAARAPARRAPARVARRRCGARRRCSRSRCSAARRRRCGCSRPRDWDELASRHRRGHRRRCPACACPTAASTSGCASSIPLGGAAARRASPRCSRSGRGAARASASRPPRCRARRRSTRSRSSRSTSTRAFLRGARLRAAAASPSCGSSGCARADAGAAAGAACSRAASPALIVAPRARRRRAVVRLRDGSPRRCSRARPTTFTLEPHLRPAELAARRPRAAARQGARAGLLEGREPRRLRRRCAGAAAPARGRASSPTTGAAAHRALARRRSSVDDPRPAQPRSSSPPATTPTSSRAAPARPRVDAAAPFATAARPLRRGDSLHARASTRRARPTRQLRARRHRLPASSLADYLDDRPAAPADGRTPARRSRVRFPPFGAARPTRSRRGRDGPIGDAAAAALRALRPTRALYALAQRAARRSRSDAVRLRAAPSQRYLAARLPLHRAPPPRARARSTASCSTPSRLLPAVLGRDGAAAADGRRPGARGHRLHARARSTASASEYVVRDLDAHSWVEACFPGSAGSRSTRRRPPRRRARSSPTRRARPPRRRAPARRRPAATAPRDPAPARRAAAAGRRAGWRSCIAAGVARRRCCSAAVRRGGAARRRAPPRPRRPSSPSSSARCAARGRDPPPGDDAARARAPARRARRRRAGYVRALRDARYGGRRPRRRRARQRRALRRELGARASGCAGRLRALWALPPRLRGCRSRAPASTLERRWTDVYELFQRGTRAARGRRLPRRRRSRWPRARDLEPDKTSIREALGRALFGAQRYERGRARSSRPSSSARRPTTTRCSASAARCSCSGRHAEARHPLALAASLRPERARLPALPRPARGAAGRRSAPLGATRRRRCARRRRAPHEQRPSSRSTLRAPSTAPTPAARPAPSTVARAACARSARAGSGGCGCSSSCASATPPGRRPRPARAAVRRASARPTCSGQPAGVDDVTSPLAVGDRAPRRSGARAGDASTASATAVARDSTVLSSPDSFRAPVAAGGSSGSGRSPAFLLSERRMR